MACGVGWWGVRTGGRGGTYSRVYGDMHDQGWPKVRIRISVEVCEVCGVCGVRIILVADTVSFHIVRQVLNFQKMSLRIPMLEER